MRTVSRVRSGPMPARLPSAGQRHNLLSRKLASHGLEGAMKAIPELPSGINTHDGAIAYEAVAVAYGITYSVYES